MKRRDFLKGSTMAVVGAGFVAAMPIMPAVLNAMDTEAPEADTAVAGTADAAVTMSEPLVVRVNDLATGSMQMFFGTQEVAYNDPQLAARLVQASRQ
jgi:hypothetical protein